MPMIFRTIPRFLFPVLLAGCAAARGPQAPALPARDAAAELGRTRLTALSRGDYLTVAQTTHPAELRRTRAAFDSLLAADSANYVAQRLFRLSSTAQLRELSDAEFTAGLMRFQLELRGARQYFASVRGVDVVGALAQGHDTAHVVYRWRFPPDSVPLRSYQVETLVRCGAAWCGSMAADFTSLLRLLKEPMVPVGPIPLRRPPE